MEVMKPLLGINGFHLIPFFPSPDFTTIPERGAAAKVNRLQLRRQVRKTRSFIKDYHGSGALDRSEGAGVLPHLAAMSYNSRVWNPGPTAKVPSNRVPGSGSGLTNGANERFDDVGAHLKTGADHQSDRRPSKPNSTHSYSRPESSPIVIPVKQGRHHDHLSPESSPSNLLMHSHVPSLADLAAKEEVHQGMFRSNSKAFSRGSFSRKASVQLFSVSVHPQQEILAGDGFSAYRVPASNSQLASPRLSETSGSTMGNPPSSTTSIPRRKLASQHGFFSTTMSSESEGEERGTYRKQTGGKDATSGTRSELDSCSSFTKSGKSRRPRSVHETVTCGEINVQVRFAAGREKPAPRRQQSFADDVRQWFSSKTWWPQVSPKRGDKSWRSSWPLTRTRSVSAPVRFEAEKEFHSPGYHFGRKPQPARAEAESPDRDRIGHAKGVIAETHDHQAGSVKHGDSPVYADNHAAKDGGLEEKGRLATAENDALLYTQQPTAVSSLFYSPQDPLASVDESSSSSSHKSPSSNFLEPPLEPLEGDLPHNRTPSTGTIIRRRRSSCQSGSPFPTDLPPPPRVRRASSASSHRSRNSARRNSGIAAVPLEAAVSIAAVATSTMASTSVAMPSPVSPAHPHHHHHHHHPFDPNSRSTLVPPSTASLTITVTDDHGGSSALVQASHAVQPGASSSRINEKGGVGVIPHDAHPSSPCSGGPGPVLALRQRDMAPLGTLSRTPRRYHNAGGPVLPDDPAKSSMQRLAITSAASLTNGAHASLSSSSNTVAIGTSAHQLTVVGGGGCSPMVAPSAATASTTSAAHDPVAGVKKHMAWWTGLLSGAKHTQPT
ncbi:hypothetical protein HDU96_004516 [Phlyctochytrium bullatum]|nr:hypothetical protein HDU96_004516 [Phlyctochytrium bullatum]